MSDETKDTESKDDSQLTLQLTDEQKKMLVDAFGSEFEGRIKSIKLEKIAGYLKAEAHAN